MAETVRAKALRTLTNSDKRHPPYGLFWCEHERSDIEVMQCGLCEITPSDRPCKWAMNLMEHLKATHPVPVADKTAEIPGYTDKWIDERRALEFPWSCDCRNCGEYQSGSCPLYGCICKADCRKDPPCAIERCVGYWPASDQYDKLAEDRLIMYLQRVSMPTANEIAPLFPKELLAQAYNKGLIQGVENGYRYDLGESTEEFYWRINHTPWTLAAVAKQNDRNGIGVYEPFEKWRLLMRHRKKAPTAR